MTTADLRNEYRRLLKASGLTAAAFKAACEEYMWAWARAMEDSAAFECIEDPEPERWVSAATAIVVHDFDPANPDAYFA